MNAKVVAFEHYFQDGSKLCKWAMDKFSLGEEVVMMKMDDPTRGWLQVDSGKNQMETHNLLSALLLDRGAHMLEAIGKLKPNQVRNYLVRIPFCVMQVMISFAFKILFSVLNGKYPF